MADISKRLEKAEKYLQKGKTESALEEYLDILQEEPNNDLVRQSAAELCISLGRNTEAAQFLGLLFEKQAAINDQSKAVITYKKLARVTTPSFEHQSRYGQLVEKSHKKEAVECYHHAVKGFADSGRKAEAVKVLNRLVALEPTLENHRQQGDLAAEAGDKTTAAAAYLKVGELAAAGNDNAAPWYAKAYALDPSNAGAALQHARSLLAAGDAAAALQVVEPFAGAQNSTPELRDTYAAALLALGRAADAAPIVMEQYERDPSQLERVGGLIQTLIRNENSHAALQLAQKIEESEQKRGRRREFVAFMKEITDPVPPGAEFLEYLVELYNATNRESDYCRTLIRLFELYYASGNFIKAGDSLDLAAEVDPYEAGHAKRLEMLRGKLDESRFNAIAGRFASTVTETEQKKEQPSEGGEPTVLEDFMLQAEIYLQYSMRSKAVERLQRINKLFPREEEKNEKLRLLYGNAGLVPKYEDTGAAAPPPSGAVQLPGSGSYQAYQPPAVPATPIGDEAAVDNIARVTEITRNIYRQANVKGVLFAAVNDVGRHWNASRCIAGLCTPGKPPSAALEYCAPGVKQSDVMAIVKVIGAMQALAVASGSVAISDAANAPELASIKTFVESQGIKSIVAVPLLDGEEHSGILVLEQCNTQRQWRPTDLVVLKTIADQMVLAVHNAKLRSLMKSLAVTDEKSGLLKRSSYLDVVLSETKRCLQQNSTASIMLLQFGKAAALVKEIGESGVESMMAQIGQAITAHVRQNDVAVRYDLTSIALLLADTNDKNSFFVVDKLRKALAGIRVANSERPVPVTAGIAEAVIQQQYDPIDIVTEVINRAEVALEAAKAEGGNKAQSVAPVLQAAAVA